VVSAMASPQESEFQVIPNTPFGALSRSQGRLETKVIFNLADGRVLFDSAKENIIIGKQYILGSTGDLVMQGLRGNESVFFLVDVATGSIRWLLKDIFGSGMFAEVIDGSPIESDGGNFIIGTTGGMSGGSIYCFSAADGTQIWKSALPKTKGAQTTTKTATKLATSFLEKDKFIYMKGQAIMAYDIASGKPIWSEPAKQKGLPDLVIYDPKGLIIASAVDPNNTAIKPTMAMYDYSTGQELWAEQVKLKGTVKTYSYGSKGLIISLDAGNGSSLINVINLQTGSYVYPEFYKVNGAVTELKLLNKAVYVRTTLEEDLISLETNASLLPKNISSKPEQLLMNVRKDELSFTFNPSNAMLYITDISQLSQKPLVQDKISFEQGETPSSIEYMNGLILLSSSQTLAAYDMSGKEIFKTHIPAPGISGWKKALYATSAALNTMDAMRYADLEAKAKEASQNTDSPEARQFCDAIGQLANQGASAHIAAASREMDMIKKRFKASASGNDVQFILSKFESKDFGLIGVSKNNGSKVVEINFGKDKEPRYLLDDVSRVIYYQATSGELKAIPYSM
jgi:outer membrane protein assembly factor BamB